MSAPDCLITSCGATALPSDFDILRPCSSSVKPWVTTTSNGAHAARAAAFQQRGLEPAAVLVGAFEIHHGVGAAVALAADAGEAGKFLGVLQHEGVGGAGVEPDVEDVVDLLPGSVAPSFASSPRKRSRAPGAYQASAPSRSKASAMRALTRSSSRISTEPSPFSRTNTAIGTPQARWREITQSGLL